MLSTVTLLALVAMASANVNMDSYSFEQFLSEHNLHYHPSELVARRAIFDKELASVRAHNKANSTFKRTMNKYSVMTAGEKMSTMGRTKTSHKTLLANSQPLPEDFTIESVESLPKHVDWRTKGVVSAVKDQGHCGSCWAFASTAVIESHAAIVSGGKLYDLSVQQVAMCTPNVNQCGGQGGCHGATSQLAFQYMSGTANGLLQEFEHPYLSYYGEEPACGVDVGTTGNFKVQMKGYVQLPENNYASLMNAVAKVGPVAISVDASSWHSYEGGIFDGCDQEQPDVNHAVVLVGYGTDEETGEDYWLVRNSWSASWGENGYIRVKRTADEQGRCGTDVTPLNGSNCDGQTEPVKVCGTCGILYDNAFPMNVRA